MKLKVAEDALQEYISGRGNVPKLENALSTAFSACPFRNRAKKFTVIMSKKNFGPNDEFFGMMVFPAVDQMEQIAKDVCTEFTPFKTFSDAWKNIDEWVIEIDPRLLDQAKIGLNQKEAVACMIHEVGHTVYSDKVPAKFRRVWGNNLAKANTATKAGIKAGYVLFMIPLAVALSVTNIPSSLTNDQNEERFSDSLAKECGYGEYLISALDKIISCYGMIDPRTASAIAENKITAELQWSVKMVTNIVDRRNRLASDLFGKSAKSKSEYIKRLSDYVMTNIGVTMRESYSGDAVESILSAMDNANYEKAYEFDCFTPKFNAWDSSIHAAMTGSRFTPGTPAFEGILNLMTKKGLPNWRDIDQIQIRIDKIRTNEDRELVLDIIYDFINEITNFMDYMNKKGRGSQYRNEAEKMLRALDEYREIVLNRRVSGSAASSARNVAERRRSLQQMMLTGEYEDPDGYEG